MKTKNDFVNEIKTILIEIKRGYELLKIKRGYELLEFDNKIEKEKEIIDKISKIQNRNRIKKIYIASEKFWYWKSERIYIAFDSGRHVNSYQYLEYLKKETIKIIYNYLVNYLNQQKKIIKQLGDK